MPYSPSMGRIMLGEVFLCTLAHFLVNAGMLHLISLESDRYNVPFLPKERKKLYSMVAPVPGIIKTLIVSQHGWQQNF